MAPNGRMEKRAANCARFERFAPTLSFSILDGRMPLGIDLAAWQCWYVEHGATRKYREHEIILSQMSLREVMILLTGCLMMFHLQGRWWRLSRSRTSPVGPARPFSIPFSIPGFLPQFSARITLLRPGLSRCQQASQGVGEVN